jgi:hypothetical protein
MSQSAIVNLLGIALIAAFAWVVVWLLVQED